MPANAQASMQIEVVTPDLAASNTFKQIQLRKDDPNDRIFILHHCKVTQKSIQFMQEIQKLHPRVEVAMVTAPYNGMEGKFSAEYEEALKGLNVQYIKDVWAFLPDNAYRRAKADPSDVEVSFFPPTSSKPASYGLNLLLEFHVTIRAMEQRGVDQMAKMMDYLLQAAAPMHGFSPDEFNNVALALQSGKGQRVMDDFLQKQEDYLKKNPITKEILDQAVTTLTNLLEQEWPSVKEDKDKTDESPFTAIRTAINNKGKVVAAFKEAIKTKMEGVATVPVCKSDGGKWEMKELEMKKADWKVPRALTKAMEAFFAPFENLALDGASAFKKIKELSPNVFELFDNYVVIEVHDMEYDDIGAVNGLKTLSPPPGRHVTAVQMSTSAKSENFNLSEVPHFFEFLAEHCPATGQETLYVFDDDESWNKLAVKNTVKVFYP